MLIKERLRELNRTSLDGGGSFSKFRLARFIDCDIAEIPHKIRRGEIPQPDAKNERGPYWTSTSLREHWEGKLKRVNKLATERSAVNRLAAVNGGPPTMLSDDKARADYAAQAKSQRQKRREQKAAHG